MNKTTYKRYPFPMRVLIGYIVACVLVGGLMYFFGVLLDNDALITPLTVSMEEHVMDTIIAVIIYLVAFVVIAGLSGLIVASFGKNKKYRSIGLYRFINVSAVLFGVAFVVIVVLLWGKENYTFFHFVKFFFTCGAPIFLSIFLQLRLERCKRCGLLNTFTDGSIQTENVGKYHKFHTEGGYTEDCTARVAGYTVEYGRYIPKTTVYDGQYEKTRETTCLKCCVCSNIVKYTVDYEEKVETDYIVK